MSYGNPIMAVSGLRFNLSSLLNNTSARDLGMGWHGGAWGGMGWEGDVRVQPSESDNGEVSEWLNG